MALTDATRDRLLALKVAAEGVAQYAGNAADNANSDSVTADPLMKATRSGYLICKQIAEEFLTIDRPNTAGTRYDGSDIHTGIDTMSATSGVKDQIKATFNTAVTYSVAQIQSRLLPFLAAGDISNADITSLETSLGGGVVIA